MTSPAKPAPNVFDLSREARTAIAAGAGERAVELLSQAVELEPNALGLWLNLAAAYRVLGNQTAAIEAVDKALAIEPRDFSALLTKASLYDHAGDEVEAGRLYGLALLFRPEAISDPAIAKAISRAEAVNSRYLENYSQAIESQILNDIGGNNILETNGRRFLNISTQKSPLYTPNPSTYYYPGLPSFEFYDRAVTPWIELFESYTADIQAELAQAMADRIELFAPYVAEPAHVPIDQWKELNHSPRWSALHIIRAGALMAYASDLFPKTLEALSHLPQPDIANRSPSAMFSALQPQTRIPPHTGVSNARLVVHLPLIVPQHCGFRVGSEVRQWEVGKAWVFDDTIEHEARNDSDEIRVILIADIWNVFMSPQDKAVYSSVVTAADSFHGWTNSKAKNEL